jgi:hypothetical protein
MMTSRRSIPNCAAAKHLFVRGGERARAVARAQAPHELEGGGVLRP